ncbi:MAG: hypothetical protein R2881_00140 [Eubacteriales bacterium]
MQDELERNRRMQIRYRKEIDQLPKDRCFSERSRDHQYCYLNYRDKNKVVSKYLGKLDPIKVEDMKKSISERKRYEDLLRKLRSEEKFIEKAIR